MIIDDAYIRHADNRETQLIATMPRNTVPLDLTKFVVSFLGVILADATMVSHSSFKVLMKTPYNLSRYGVVGHFMGDDGSLLSFPY